MIIRLALTSLILLNLSCSTSAPTILSSGIPSDVKLELCHFPNHDTELLCGSHFVYEDRAKRAGRMIPLNIIVARARAWKPMRDPVFFLAGGPGQGAAKIAAAGEDALMRELRRERDLVFIDQRGTGNSHVLQCTATTTNRAALQSRFDDAFDPAIVRACREELEKRARLDLYTTAMAIDDMDEVRRSLGYDKINLYGVSYGSLSVLEYIRRYSARVRAAVLVGVATPAAKLPLQFAKGAQQAMDKLLNDCAADESCASAFPTLRQDFAVALNAFSNGPVSFEMISPATGKPETVTMSRGLFTERIRLMLYDHAGSSLLPYLIHRAARGDWLTFGKVVARTALPTPYSISFGPYLTITCSESLPFITPEEIDRQTADTFVGDYRTSRHQGACAEWVRGDVPEDFFFPVKADVPVLMISGEVDPATPPELAEEAARHLPNSRWINLRNAPHNYTSDCARTLAVEFIAEGSAANLTTRCDQPMRRPRFLTELPQRYN